MPLTAMIRNGPRSPAGSRLAGTRSRPRWQDSSADHTTGLAGDGGSIRCAARVTGGGRPKPSYVGRPEIQKFAGALQGHRARKGVFITTSSFSKDAHEYVERIDSKIVLIDGATLSRFMVDSGVGVSLVTSYDVKRVDSDYFSDE